MTTECTNIRFFKVTELPATGVPDSIYLLLEGGFVRQYVTDSFGTIVSAPALIETLTNLSKSGNNLIYTAEDTTQTIIPFAPVAFSGAYNDLVGTPTNTSSFTNDGDGSSPYATLDDIPTDVGDLTLDFDIGSSIRFNISDPTTLELVDRNDVVISNVSITPINIAGLSSYTGLDIRYYTEAELDDFFAGNTPITGYNKVQWDEAYSWGDHSTAGYLTSFSETDPIFQASPAGSILNSQITNWDIAYSWGDHRFAGYLTEFIETDPLFQISAAFGIDSFDITNWDLAYTNLIDGASFNTGDGNLFLNKPNEVEVVVNLDGRYALASASASSLNELTDVTLTLPLSGQFLKYNGTVWVNADITEADISDFGNYVTLDTVQTITADKTFQSALSTQVEFNNTSSGRTTAIGQGTTFNIFAGANSGLDFRVNGNATASFAINTGGNVILADLAGTGQRMVVANGSGLLSTQAIPSGGASISDAVYGIGWDGDTTTAASRNAIYDKIETLAVGADYLPLAGGTMTGQIVSTNIIPDGDVTRSLGVNGTAYATVYGYNYHFQSNIVADIDWIVYPNETGGGLSFAAETGSGTNTFTDRYTLNDSGTPTNSTDLITKTYADDNIPDNTDYVDLTTNQTVGGTKTFTAEILADDYIQMAAITGATKLAGYSNISFDANDHLRVVGSALNDRYIFASANTAERTYTLQDASGTLAFTSDVPDNTDYVDLTTNQTVGGVKTFENIIVQDDLPITPRVGNIVSSSQGLLYFKTDNTFNIALPTGVSFDQLSIAGIDLFTAKRTLTVQDADGTIALISDIPAGAGDNIYNTNGSLTGARTVTMGTNELQWSGTGGIIYMNSGRLGVQVPVFGGSRLGDNELQAKNIDTQSILFKNNAQATVGSLFMNPAFDTFTIKNFNGEDNFIEVTANDLDDTNAARSGNLELGLTLNYIDTGLSSIKLFNNDVGTTPGDIGDKMGLLFQTDGTFQSDKEVWIGRFDGTTYTQVLGIATNEVFEIYQPTTVYGSISASADGSWNIGSDLLRFNNIYQNKSFVEEIWYTPTDTEPSSPSQGQTYYDNSEDTIRLWNGASWESLAKLGDIPGAGTDYVSKTGGGTFDADISVPDEFYDEAAWNASLEVPTKNAIRDKLEGLNTEFVTLSSSTQTVLGKKQFNDIVINNEIEFIPRPGGFIDPTNAAFYYNGTTDAWGLSGPGTSVNIANLNGIDSFTAARTFTFPDASGTFALTTDVPDNTNYVDLTTAQTVGGTKTFSSNTIFTNGLNSGGKINLTSSESSAFVSSAATLYNDTNRFAFKDASLISGESLIFDLSSLTGDRVVTWPDATGTIALTSDLVGLGTIGGSITDNQIAVGAATADDIEGSSELTYNSASATLALSANQTTQFQKAINLFTPDLGAITGASGAWSQITFGRAASTRNAAEFSFVYNTLGGTDNYFSLGLYNTQVLELHGDESQHWLGDVIYLEGTGDAIEFQALGAPSVLIDATDTTAGDPAIFGMSNMNSLTEGARWQFGDSYNTIENQYNQGIVVHSYHTLVLDAGHESLTDVDYTSGLFSTDVTESLRILQIHDRGMVIKDRTATARTENHLEFQTSVGTVLSGVGTDGSLFTVDEVYGIGWDGSLEVPTKNAIYDKIETLGAGASFGGEWRFDTGITATPASGDLRYNNVLPASVTNLYVSSTTNGGFVADAILGVFKDGDILYIQQDDDAAKYLLVNINGTPTDNVGDWTIPVTIEESGTLPDNNARLKMLWVQSGSATYLPLTGGTLTGDLTIDNGATQANFLLENGFIGARQDGQTYKALFGTSTTANNFLVGGNTTGAVNTLDTYLRIRSIADGDLQFTENATNHTVWHEGNRPTIDNMAYKSDLGAAQDLDTYLVTGLYHQNSNTDAAGGTNYPSPYAGMLTVKEGDAFIYQEYQEYQGFRKTWRRQKYISTWSAWTLQHDDNSHPQSASGNRWGVWPAISTGGVMEVGAYIDFHNTDADTSDFTGRLHNINEGQLRWSSAATTDMIEVYNSSTEFSQLAANASGGYLVLSDDALTNTIIRGYGDSDFYGGSIFTRGIQGGIGTEHLDILSGAMWSVGGGYFHTATASITGTIAIRLPATARNTSDMISFSVDIFDYAGGDGAGESIKVDICGYPNTGGWANTNATIHTTKTDRDYNVRFYYDATYHYVYIGETSSNWAYPQVKIYNLFLGYNANIENWDDGWSVTIPSTFTGTADHTVSNNLPTAGRARLSDNEYIYFGTGTGESSIRSNGSDTYWDFRADRDLFLRDVTTTRFTFDISTGNLTAANFVLSSDERMKKNIRDAKVKPIETNWKQFQMIDGDGEERYGVIAQELEKVHPEFVSKGKDGMKAVAYTDLLIAKNIELEARIDRLELMIESLIK